MGKSLLPFAYRVAQKQLKTEMKLEPQGEDEKRSTIPSRIPPRSEGSVKVKSEPGDSAVRLETKPLVKKKAKRGSVARQAHYTKANWAKKLVWEGQKEKTSSGLRKRDLVCNRKGVIVSKKLSAFGKLIYSRNNLDLWTKCLMEVREEKAMTGFLMQKKEGTPAQRKLYKEIRTRYEDAVSSRLIEIMRKQPSLVGRIRELAAAEQLISRASD